MKRLLFGFLGVALCVGLTSSCGAGGSRYQSAAGPKNLSSSPGTAETEWKTVQSKALELLKRLLSLDTSNPPGRELPAAKVLARFLSQEGIEAQVIRAGPARANVFARLDANLEGPPKRPLLLLSHLDALPTDPAAWPNTTPPFGATVNKGSLWGRGVLDGKGLAVLHTMALVRLKQTPRARPILLAAVADGARGDDLGISTLLKAQPELGQAWLALTKGGMSIKNMFGDGRTLHAVANSEKGFAVLRLTVITENANEVLAQAVTKLNGYRPSSRLSAPVLELLDHVADDAWFPKRQIMRSNVLASIFLLDGLSERKATAPLVQNTITIANILSGAHNDRVAARAARATVLCHLLPDSSPEQIRQRIRAVISDPLVHVDIQTGYDFNSSPPDRALFEVIDRIMRKDTSATVQLTTPFMSGQTSDARYLRALGVPTYGFIPVVVDHAALKSIDGRDEQLPLSEFNKGLRRMFEITKALSNLP